MSKKTKKKKKFTATQTVKAMARTAIGTPPPSRRKESRKRVKNQKHKPTLGKLLSDSESS